MTVSFSRKNGICNGTLRFLWFCNLAYLLAPKLTHIILRHFWKLKYALSKFKCLFSKSHWSTLCVCKESTQIMHVWQKYSTFIMELGLRINFRVMVNQRDKFQNKIISGLIPISDVFFLQFKRFSSIQNVSLLENITPSFRRFGPKPWLLWRFFT